MVLKKDFAERYQHMKKAEGEQGGERVIYATAVEVVRDPVSLTAYAEPRGEALLPVNSAPIPTERAICRRCRQPFNRDYRFNDCEADYYRCEGCRQRKGDAIIGVVTDICSIA